MIIAPSLLAADFTRFGAEALRVERSGAEWLHLDIMDGQFVPNISFGPQVVKVVRPLVDLFLDVHLMCQKPEILIEPFVKAGADELTVHVELGDVVNGLIWKIRSYKKKAGLAINPGTSMQEVKPYLSKIDLLLVMTVNPGFGGQPFISECLSKVRQAAEWRKSMGLSYHIQVDGGINFSTATDCAKEGADVFVSGTGLFGEKSLRGAVSKMRRVAEKAAANAQKALNR